MRKALNENPVVQIAILGVLAVVVGFLLLTHVAHKGGGSSAPTSATATTASGAATASAPGTDTGTLAPAAGATAPPSSASGAPLGKFVVGPGLPAPVVKAYADDKAVVLFVFRHRGIDDAAVRRSVELLRSRPDLAVFITHAAHIARCSRITQGVDVNRVPALVVLRPRHLTRGTPTASVSYGFRGPDSVDQAIRDALYKGPTNLPSYPR